MSSLPDDIIEENILTRLPVKSITRFRCVSKNWYTLFQNPNFIRKHLNLANLTNNFNILVADRQNIDLENSFSYINSNTLSSSTALAFFGHHALSFGIDYPRNKKAQIIGSCNGLVCIQPFPRTIFIWNPATREYKQVADPSPDSKPEYCCVYGFGYDCKSGDYKVLAFVFTGGILEAKIYSLASNSWKEIGYIMPCDFSGSRNRGILHNGVLHWIATRSKSSFIGGFDIADETFHEVTLPNNHSDEDDDLSLGILEGKLSLLCRNRMEDPYEDIDVWTMVDNKWSKHLKITAHMTDMYYGRPIQTLHNGEILFESGPMSLMSYDPNLERARALEINGFPDNYYEVESYIETLVALNSGTYVGQQYIE